jgi:predicted alpha/beta-fold hydrolase
MIRISRQLYDHGYKVVRVNLRCCGTGFGLSKKPYYAGCSHDILHVLQQLDEKPIVIGFSLGGNVILKLAGELGNTAKHYVESFIAVCPTLDLSVTLKKIQQKRYFYYHSYYLKGLRNQSKGLLNKEVHSIYEFDRDFICPEWGFKSVEEYYQKTSSKRFIPDIQENTKILLTEDDPFISVAPLESLTIPKCVKVYTTTFGGHMGFIGHTEKEYQSFWLDQQIVDWVDNLKVEEVNNSGQ